MVCCITEIKIQKELQQQKLLSSNLMISIDFVNHLKGTLKTWTCKISKLLRTLRHSVFNKMSFEKYRKLGKNRRI